MFRFVMNSKDSDDYPVEKLDAAGFKVVHDGRMSIEKTLFQCDSFTPENLDAAMMKIKTVFFFPPVAVWINGKRYDPFKDENSFVKPFPS